MAISDTMAEAGVIASLIYNPTYILHSEQLKYNHFYNKETSCLYWAINNLVKQGIENIDSFNLATMINSNEGIKNTFERYKINLEEYVNLSKNIKRDTIEEYKVLVNRVLALAYKRDLHRHLKRFDKSCVDVEQDDISELSNNIYNTLNNLNEKYIYSKEDIKLLGEKVDDIWDKIMKMSEKGKGNYKSKIPSFNDYFDYIPSNLIVVAARWKAGKSAFALNECLHLLKQGATVGYFDTENPEDEFLIRVLANLAQIRVRDIRNKAYSASDDIILSEWREYVKKQKLIHIYDTAWTPDKIFTTSKILQYKYGMDFLIFDYLKYTEGQNAYDTYIKLGRLTDSLKNDVAGNLQIPVLSLAQLNRENNVADSDNISRYSSTIIHWQKKSAEELGMGDWRKVGNYKAQVRANRLGAQMDNDESISCVFDGDRMTIYEAPEQPKVEEI